MFSATIFSKLWTKKGGSGVKKDENVELKFENPPCEADFQIEGKMPTFRDF